MHNRCENRYKTCRTSTTLTQEQASELLGVAPRTLSDYENGHSRVPDDIVAQMADIYNSPLLAWWHMKHHSVLGRYLPEVMPPKSNTDVAFQLILAQDDLSPTVNLIKDIMRDGEVTLDEVDDYEKAVECLKIIHGKLLSVIVFADGSQKREEAVS